MCIIIALLLSMQDCMPPDPRPGYEQLWSMYGANPDCLNRARHVRYLEKLKGMPMRTGDSVTELEYDRAVDLYIIRMNMYCESK